MELLAGPAQAGHLIQVEVYAAGRVGGPPLTRSIPERRQSWSNVDLLDLIDAVRSAADGILFSATSTLLGIGFTLIFGVIRGIDLSYATASIEPHTQPA